ncbi:MAG: hypothetical protein QOE62_1464 [Actinomycetota bacterium]|nr:hypothetical protein [Actinomycetota bacterium]
MPDRPLDAAMDELYGVDPSEFVAVRKRLSTALRSAGEKEAAKELQAVRRPSTSAWALNQVARQQPEVVESLLDASRALFAAQTRGSNKPDVLREAIRTHREAIDAAADAALAILGDRSNDKFRGEIVSTLRAVSTDEAVSEQLRTGRMVREVSASGFPDAAGLTLVPDLPTSKPSGKAKPAKFAKRADDDADKAVVTDRAGFADKAAKAEHAREEKRRADLAKKKAALQDAQAAEVEAERAQARVDELQDALDVARRELRTAREQSRKAKSTLRDMR